MDLSLLSREKEKIMRNDAANQKIYNLRFDQYLSHYLIAYKLTVYEENLLPVANGIIGNDC